MTKEESAGAAVLEIGTKLLVEIRVSQKVLEKGTRGEAPHAQLKSLRGLTWRTQEGAESPERRDRQISSKTTKNQPPQQTSKTAALRDSLPGHNRWRQPKPKNKAAPWQLKGWFGSQTATSLGVFVSIPHYPLEGPHKPVVAFGTGEGHRYSNASLVEVRDLLESTSLPRRALRRVQSRE